MKINYIFRSKDLKMYSIENQFKYIIDETKKEHQVNEIYVPKYRFSIKNILENIICARKSTGDIFHVTGDVHYVTIGLNSKKTILTIHDIVGAETFKNNLFKKYVYILIWAIIPSFNCRFITTISEKSKQEILKYCPWVKNKLYVIPDSISNKIKFSPKEFNKSKPRILLIGTSSNKNHTRILKAIDKLSCIVDIVGIIPDDEKKLLEELKIQYENSYHLSDEQIIAKYKESDIVIFASTYEGFGVVIPEAQRMGRVVITSNISPMKEVSGEGACLVDPYDVDNIRQSIIKIIDNDQYRENLIEKGYYNSEKYITESIAKEYINLYSKMQN